MPLDTRHIKTFVDLNIKEIRSVHCVARMLGMSYETLRKSFLRYERMPLYEYIVRRKVAVMKEHLRMADDPCFIVCYEYGLREDTGAKMFKRVTGLTMREFRLRHGRRTH